VPVTVQLRVTGGTATSGSDFKAWSPTTLQVTIPAGQLSATFVVQVLGDKTSEADETVVVEVVSLTGATGVGTKGTLTILDDDRKLVALATGPGAAGITIDEVAPVLAAALAQWRAAGADPSRLAHVRVEIAPLADGQLGEALGTTVRLDPDAAGWGWSTRLDAVDPNRIDLLTVLLHEIGHVLGYEHTETGVMAAALLPGVRRELGPVDAAAAAPRPVTALRTAALRVQVTGPIASGARAARLAPRALRLVAQAAPVEPAAAGLTAPCPPRTASAPPAAPTAVLPRSRRARPRR
jgi:hypothetical protein